jgi:hypothetical protein
MDLHSLPAIVVQANRSFQAWKVAVSGKRSARICGQMALDLAQKRFAEILQFLCADAGDAAKLG